MVFSQRKSPEGTTRGAVSQLDADEEIVAAQRYTPMTDKRQHRGGCNRLPRGSGDAWREGDFAGERQGAVGIPAVEAYFLRHPCRDFEVLSRRIQLQFGNDQAGVPPAEDVNFPDQLVVTYPVAGFFDDALPAVARQQFPGVVHGNGELIFIALNANRFSLDRQKSLRFDDADTYRHRLVGDIALNDP